LLEGLTFVAQSSAPTSKPPAKEPLVQRRHLSLKDLSGRAIARSGSVVALAVCVLAPARAHAVSTPDVSLTGPLSGDQFAGFGFQRSVTFSGTAANAGSVTSIAVDALRLPSLDPTVESNWRYGVATVAPTFTSASTITFSLTTTFVSTVWPDGGIAKVRVVAVLSDGTRFQVPGQDAFGQRTTSSSCPTSIRRPGSSTWAARPTTSTPSTARCRTSRLAREISRARR
jgi:hypothetical protein